MALGHCPFKAMCLSMRTQPTVLKTQKRTLSKAAGIYLLMQPARSTFEFMGNATL